MFFSVPVFKASHAVKEACPRDILFGFRVKIRVGFSSLDSNEDSNYIFELEFDQPRSQGLSSSRPSERGEGLSSLAWAGR